MRLLYTLLFHLLVPIVLLRLYWRGFKAPEYRKRWTERLAIYKQKYPDNVIWIHAVSVGEAEAVFPLVKRLQKQYSSDNFLITTTTPTGSARVQNVLSDTVTHVYLPYDLPSVVSRFIKIFKPKIAIIMEKEIWPNLYAQCGKQNIPLFIINARLSANSAKGYKKIPALVATALSNVTAVMTQTQEDCDRFIEIGSAKEKTHVAGNIKFDIVIPEQAIEQGKRLNKQLFAGRFVWIIASTHKGEDEIFLDMYQQIKQAIPSLLLLMVPRHPERFKTVKRLAEERQLKTIMRSSNEHCTSDTDVYIADTMGELKMLYAAADIGFVGGSMVPVGGHNILEPLAVDLPVIFGPYMINFKQISDNVLKMQAAVQCQDEMEIIKTVQQLYDDINFRKSLTQQGAEFLRRNQGATDRIFNVLENYL
ncbi:MAG: lipid IV(A) 3-deoxy-D-manno-octulosonic acid transferase [Methylococcales bacterium]|nr:lipid IV(A) 3-deoxy-D-manno-octulosonic acid transferase [Methylococcales bacterium]